MITTSSEMRLYALTGERLYVNTDERRRFLAAAEEAPPSIRSLCLTLTYTGCRVSEALSLTSVSIQAEAGAIAFRTLKKRNRIEVREVPVPLALIKVLIEDHALDAYSDDPTRLLWPISRTTAWRQAKAVMAQAGISGAQATPKGLRHGYGIWAQHSGVPLNMIQKWMGHAHIKITAIYTMAVGPEEQAIAARMWRQPQPLRDWLASWRVLRVDLPVRNIPLIGKN